MNILAPSLGGNMAGIPVAADIPHPPVFQRARKQKKSFLALPKKTREVTKPADFAPKVELKALAVDTPL